MIYRCCDEHRKAAVLGNPALNGIDYLEVLGYDADPLGLQPQTHPVVHCLKAAPAGLTPDNILITGGESITGIKAVDGSRRRRAPPREHDRSAEEAYFTSLPTPPTCCWSAPVRRRFLAVHTAAGQLGDPGGEGSVRSHRGARPASIRNSPRSSSRSRSSARRSSTASRSPRIVRRTCPRLRRSTTSRRITAPSAP